MHRVQTPLLPEPDPGLQGLNSGEPDRVSLFGMQIDAVDTSTAVARLMAWVREADGTCRYVVTPNVDHVLRIQQSIDLRRAYDKAAMVVADGVPVVLASRLLHKPLPARVCSADLVPALFDASSPRKPLRVFLLGARPGVAKRAAKQIATRWSGVSVVGTYSPCIHGAHNGAEDDEILQRIEEAAPNVLIVGWGCPKQETWVHAHRQRISASVALCVGATIDFLAGERSRAPRWMQRCALEWFYRLVSDPRRLARRYAYDAWSFPRLLWREWRMRSARDLPKTCRSERECTRGETRAAPMRSWNTGDDAADGLSNSRPTEPPRVETHNAVPGNSCHASMRSAVTLVVPCFNEEAILPRLRWVLSDLAQSLAHRYQFEFLLVDDGSTDETPRVLGREFGDEPNCRILTHETNRGIAAAIMTGIRQARSEIVCSMDCDCSYDPIQLEQMIPLLSDDVDLVTASPYHPQGRVLNVPRHRLAMSKAASFLYRRAMRPRLYCYTSCFRVYRRSTVKDVRLDHGGFPGIAELVWQLGRRDAHIVEHPAVLEVNSQRVSKMKISSTVARHLKLLGRALMDRRRVGLVGSNDARHPPDSKHDLPT